jgi:hypothetical protein
MFWVVLQGPQISVISTSSLFYGLDPFFWFLLLSTHCGFCKRGIIETREEGRPRRLVPCPGVSGTQRPSTIIIDYMTCLLIRSLHLGIVLNTEIFNSIT